MSLYYLGETPPNPAMQQQDKITPIIGATTELLATALPLIKFGGGKKKKRPAPAPMPYYPPQRQSSALPLLFAVGGIAAAGFVLYKLSKKKSYPRLRRARIGAKRAARRGYRKLRGAARRGYRKARYSARRAYRGATRRRR